MICRNCGERIDLFIGQDTRARAYLHIIKFNKLNQEGYLWGWSGESRKYCRNPEPVKE